MIANLKDVISQLKELSTVINSFKSEAVQLRIVDLIFSSATNDEDDSENAAHTQKTPKSKRLRKRVAKLAANLGGDEPVEGRRKTAVKKASRPGQRGGKGLIASLVSEGFFNKPKTINAIIGHCDVNRATKYKQNELSGPLGRSVRDGTLKRQKNADGQYEYTSG